MRMTDSYILVVDNEEYTRRLLLDLVKATGLLAHSVTDEDSALQLVENQPPEMVLVNMLNPTLERMRLLDALNTLPQTKEVPVIAVVGLGEGKLRMVLRGVFSLDGLMGLVQSAVLPASSEIIL